LQDLWRSCGAESNNPLEPTAKTRRPSARITDYQKKYTIIRSQLASLTTGKRHSRDERKTSCQVLACFIPHSLIWPDHPTSRLVFELNEYWGKAIAQQMAA